MQKNITASKTAESYDELTKYMLSSHTQWLYTHTLTTKMNYIINRYKVNLNWFCHALRRKHVFFFSYFISFAVVNFFPQHPHSLHHTYTFYANDINTHNTSTRTENIIINLLNVYIFDCTMHVKLTRILYVGIYKYYVVFVLYEQHATRYHNYIIAMQFDISVFVLIFFFFIIIKIITYNIRRVLFTCICG